MTRRFVAGQTLADAVRVCGELAASGYLSTLDHLGENVTTRAEAAEKTEQGKFHITFDKSLLGQVNGGGSEISFNTFTGDIYIRKKK